jgi:hypothetical protein
MANSADGQIKEIDYNGNIKGRVVKVDDPKMEGRIGVFIPSLITEVPHHLEEPSPKIHTIPSNLFANQSELQLSTQVQGNNFIWARPCAFLIEGGSKGKNTGGSYRIPKIGTMVTIYFENADPNRPYWMPFSPSVNGDVIAGTHIGKGTNMNASSANWKDPSKRTNINVLAEHDNGTVLYFDNNDNASSFVLRTGNGHTISVGHAAESGIILETQQGHIIQLDENSKQIRVRTQSGNSKIILGDDGNIVIEASTSIRMKAPRIDFN